jgi:MFS family permease
VGAFQERDFGWYFGGQMASATGFHMADIARGWLVYNLTGSALSLAWLRTGWSVASLIFPLVGGVVADRVRKRPVLVVGTGLVTVPPLVISLLIAVGAIHWWYLPITILLESMIFCFIVPARQAFVSTLMKPEALLNAMSLNFLAMAIPSLVFSIVGGALVESVGARIVFLLAAIAYGIGAFLFMQLSLEKQISRVNPHGWAELLEGFRYIVRHRVLITVLGLAVGRTVLLASSQAFLPIFASDVFQTGALGLGFLTASVAAGRLVGSLVIALLGNSQRQGQLLLGAGLVSGIFVVFFAQSRSFYLALVFLCLTGVAQMAYSVAEATVLQAETTKDMRGRVAGFLRMTAGLMPLTLLPSGLLIDAWGVATVVSLTAALASLLFLVAMILWPKLPG